jgi:hypothetical protein
MTRDQFVRVNVALRALPDSGPTVRRQRDSILKHERVTPAQLQAWVQRRRAAEIADAWREIANRVDSLRPGAPPASATRPAVVTPPPTGGPEDSVMRPAPRPRLVLPPSEGRVSRPIVVPPDSA